MWKNEVFRPPDEAQRAPPSKAVWMHKDTRGATASRRAVWRPPLPVNARVHFPAVILKTELRWQRKGARTFLPVSSFSQLLVTGWFRSKRQSAKPVLLYFQTESGLKTANFFATPSNVACTLFYFLTFLTCNSRLSLLSALLCSTTLQI